MRDGIHLKFDENGNKVTVIHGYKSKSCGTRKAIETIDLAKE